MPYSKCLEYTIKTCYCGKTLWWRGQFVSEGVASASQSASVKAAQKTGKALLLTGI